MRLQKMEPPSQKEHLENSGDTVTRHRKVLSRFFGVDNSELNDPFAPTSALGKSVENLSTLTRQETMDSNSSTSSNSSISKSEKTGMLSGLLLKNQMPRYRERAHSHEETRDETVKPFMKRKSAKRRLRTTSLSSRLQRSISANFRHDDRKLSKELSIEESIPGLLKVFGSRISPESQYKSVLATLQSTSAELVKEVLERYSLPKSSSQDFVLCDVIGNFQVACDATRRPSMTLTNMRDERVWVTECLHILSDDEKPLELSFYWKPEDGYLRRFEIRKRTEVELKVVDNVTHGLNVNAKRKQMTQSHANTIDLSDARFSLPKAEELVEGDEDAKKQPRKVSAVAESSETKCSTPDAKRRVGEREETESSDDPTSIYNLGPPRDCPYLLTLRGRDPKTDLILYLLHHQVCLIGGNHNSDKVEHLAVDITLNAPDIRTQHCWIFEQQVSNYPNMDKCVYSISIEPIDDAPVTVNGTSTSGNLELTSGDIVCVGEHYMFMFKDPSTEQHDPESQDLHPDVQQQHETSEARWEDRSESQHALHSSSPERWRASSTFVNKEAQEYYEDVNRLKISYAKDTEDAILDHIASMQQNKDDRGFGMAPAYILAMCMEHTAFSCSQEQMNALVTRAAALVHILAWDKTKELASNQPKELNDVYKVLRTILPNLRHIMLWMANALELLHFFNTNIRNHIGRAEEETFEGPSVVCSMQDEITAELEEVVMYTFQQSVYYLTKTLYIALPNILDTNPFLKEVKDQAEKLHGIKEVIHVFQTTFDMLHSLDVHAHINSQLFAYLLFFTNASLFNMLMERGSSGNFYKWSNGTQMRGNLDILESWLRDHNLTEQMHFLNCIAMAVDLLATPKLQLMQADWGTMRHDFPSLNAAQVHRILSQYQLGNNQPRPEGWFPPHDQVEDALRRDDILESFDNHPPLVLPNKDFKLDLQHTPSDPSFRLQIQKLCKSVPEVTMHLGQPTEHKLFSPQLKNRMLHNVTNQEGILIPSETPLLSINNSVTVHSTRNNTSEIGPINYSNFDEPHSPSYETSDEFRIRKLSRVLEAATIVENSESNDDIGVKTVTMTLAPPVTVTNPSIHSDEAISLIEMQTQLLDPPREFANEDDDEDYEEEKTERRGEIIMHDERSDNQMGLKVENENHKPHLENIGRTSSVSSTDIDGYTEEQRTQSKDRKDSVDDVFVVDLEKCEEGLGLGLIDGMHTQLHSPGIYVRKLVANGAAVRDGRLKLGDRILAVNGTSLVGSDYHSAMYLIKSSGEKLRFLVAKSESDITMKITSSSC